MGQLKREHLGYTSGAVHEPAHPGNVELLAYWERHRIPNGPLMRSAFEPLEIPALLPCIFLTEPSGEDYWFRLAGSDVEGRLYRAVTGKTLMEVFGPEDGPRTIERYHSVCRSNAPLTVQGNFQGDNLAHIKFEVLHLPLQFEDGGRGVLGGQFAFD